MSQERGVTCAELSKRDTIRYSSYLLTYIDVLKLMKTNINIIIIISYLKLCCYRGRCF